MRSLPIKVKLGLYSALLTTAATVGLGMALRPSLYKHQLDELDRQLEENAEELVHNIEKAGTVNFRKPLKPELIPVALRRRYLEVHSPYLEMHHSGNLQAVHLKGLEPGIRTMILFDRNARIGTFIHGYLTIHIGTRLGTLETMQNDLLAVMLRALPLTAVTVFLGGWLLGWRVLRPVTRLSEAAESVDVSDPERRLPLPSARDEIYRLTEVLNATFARLQGAYAAAARFSADASHQLKTPVAVLRSGLESLRDGPLTTEQSEEVADLLKQTRRLTTLVEDLLLLAQADAGRLKLSPETLDVDLLLATLADDLGVLCDDRGITLNVAAGGGLAALGDRRRVGIVLQNLGENAVKYAAENGAVNVSAAVEDGRVAIRIANTGPAVPAEQRDRLFERFHRGVVGENIRGHGLGLNIARALALAQGGDVALESSDGEWTVFVFTLPAAAVKSGETVEVPAP